MSIVSPGDKTRAYRDALLAGAQTATVNMVDPAHDLLVRRGAPTERQLKSFDDIIGLGRMTARRSLATAGTNRSIELVMTVDVVVSVWRAGTDVNDSDDLQQECEARAYALLDAVAEYVRVTDTTLGGVVRKCVCTAHDSDGGLDRQFIDKGRLTELRGVFTAEARIANQ